MSLAESREDWIVREARKRPLAERSSFLDGACAGDKSLRKRLEGVLAAPDPSERAIPQETEVAQPTLRTDLADGPDEAVGHTIGRYKILQKIGEGGCGAVYMAEQAEPVRRRVALKVIKLGMDTRGVIARFEAERQALALMDHPNIAKVLDAGATETGRPYFVMELVRGIKFTEYCDQNHLGIRQRLELFTQICQAIQHAHQKGIIHRDIKPSNILVTLHDGVPIPKVIDFGIAKATTDQRLTDKTLFTAYEQFIGTPAYMSPEQAEMSGLDIDTRSDIYSLGVLLYELLTGRTPFDPKELMESGLEAMRKTIREKDPVRPSTKVHTLSGEELTTTAKRHGVEAPRLVSQLRGDLDWIVMKCLEKDRTRRYETANGLAMDIKRHLSNEPVVARPPSKLYEFQKTFRRHKVGFLATGSVILALAIGVALTAWQAVVATRAKGAEAIQRQQSEANEKKALEARASEERLRRGAEAQELAARQRAYASDMNLAKQALAGSNLGRALELLNRQRPLAGQRDLRGWEWRYLWQQTHSDALLTLCQTGEIESLAVSADGHWLALGLVHRGGVYVWDLKTRLEAAHLAAGEAKVRLVFSPTEPLLAFTSDRMPESGKQENSLWLWDGNTRQTVGKFPLSETCLGLSFSSDGRSLATSTRQLITLWRVPEGTNIATYAFHHRGIEPTVSFATTADMSLAAFEAEAGRVRVIDLRDGKEVWSATASKDYVTSLSFSPDGKILASGAGFGEADIRLWEAASGKELGRLEGHKSWVSSLVFWPDGKRLASSSADQTIRIWDVGERKCLDVLRGHMIEVWRLALAPDQKTLISGGKDGTVCLWDTSVLHPPDERITFPESVSAWSFSADNRSILTVNAQGEVKRWSGPGFRQRESWIEPGLGFYDGTFSSDCRMLAMAFTNGSFKIWDLARRTVAGESRGEERPQGIASVIAGGKRLILLSVGSGALREWDLEANREIQSWPLPLGFESFQMSPDERFGLAVGWEGTVVCRNLTEQKTELLPLDALEGWQVTFQPDGKRMVIPSAQGYARVWDTATWREEATLRGFLNSVGSAAFSPDGQRLALSGSNPEDTVKLWDTESWQELLTLEGTGSLFSLTAFSPDGNLIGTVNNDHTLHVWHAPSWEEVKAAEGREKMEGRQP